MLRPSIAIAIALSTSSTLCAQVTFAPAVHYTVGSRPSEVSLADIDGDGDADLAVSVDLPINGVQIMLNDGSGGFSLGQQIPVSSQTRSVRFADLDGDDDPDLAVSAASQVVILLNQGGLFSVATSHPVGANARGLTAADFDRDFDLDLAVANRDSNSVSVLFNQGNATFGPATTIGVGAEPRNVVGADFDRDGLVDLVVSNHDSRTVGVMRNQGAGNFGPSTLMSVAGEKPDWVGVGDTDLDGDLDLLVSYDNNNLGRVLIGTNQGNGSFLGGISVPVGLEPSQVYAVDLSGDGIPELVTANETSDDVSVAPGLGGGQFGAAQSLPVGNYAESLALRDLDGDGDLDLAVSNRDSGSISILINTTAGATSTRPSLIVGGTTSIGATVPLQFHSPAHPNHLAVSMLSLSSGPAIILPDGRTLPVGDSGLIGATIAPNSILLDSVRWMDGSGTAYPRFFIPPLNFLIGIPFFGVSVVIDPGASLDVAAISNAVAMTVQ